MDREQGSNSRLNGTKKSDMSARRSSTIGSGQSQPIPFPCNAFPPVMAGAIHDVANTIKAPVPLVASSVLSAAALACQRNYKVRLPYGAIRPISLYLLLIANSGERKSAADGLVYETIRQLEKEHRLEFLKRSESYQQELALWDAVDSALRRKMLRANDERMNELKNKLEEHHTHRPLEPMERRYILDDITPAAIVAALSESPSASLVSNDGRTMLMGRALSDLSLINRAWDGDPLRVDRARSGSVLLDDYELSLWSMVQPGTFRDFVDHDRGRISRDTGLLARCLIAFPQSTQGTRQFDPHAFQPKAGLQDFHRQLDAILRSSTPRQVIDMGPAAILLWAKFANALEDDLSPNRYLADLTDFASKIPENAARIAAIFHVMSNRSGPIQLDHMQSAGELAEWYLHEAKRLFGTPQISPERSDAEELAQWMHSHLGVLHSFVDLSKTYIYHYGPNALRVRRRLDPALEVLGAEGRVSQVGTSKKISYRYFRPSPF